MNSRRRVRHPLKLLCGAAYRGQGRMGTGCISPGGQLPATFFAAREAALGPLQMPRLPAVASGYWGAAVIVQLQGAFAVLAAGMYRYSVAGDTPRQTPTDCATLPPGRSEAI
jgi:hypothetical protein